LTIAGSDLSWLMSVLHATHGAFAATVVEMPHPVASLRLRDDEDRAGAIVQIGEDSSAIDVRALLDRSPNVRFVFVANALPLRHAVARVIRERGHAIVSRQDSPFVIAATLIALLAASDQADERST
jgi:hypothetical protein